jgi:hypothetical protein
MVQDGIAHYEIERGSREIQLVAIANLKLNALSHALRCRLLACLAKHIFGAIDANKMHMGQTLRQLDRNLARTGAYVQSASLP